jgi:peptidoglycan/xylan/chitin deacetylase (PgdA/CDA1 family)
MRDVLVLTYHAVSETWPAELSVTPERLMEQLQFIVDRGYRGARFTDAVLDPPFPKTVAVTFDDAYRSVPERAWPVLSELDLPGTVFAVTDFVGSESPMRWPGIERWMGGAHEPELVPASWEELRQLAAAGWEIGAHGRTHPRLSTLDDATLADELQGSRTACESQLQRPCESMAYPFGDADVRVVEAAADAGYRVATGPRRPCGPRPELAWPRMGVWHDDDMRRFRKKVSPVVRKAWRSSAWTLIRRLEPARSR